MRTVTFSDAKVARLINDNFIATWINRNPSFHNCEASTELNIATYSGEAYATRNFCTFFVTPELELLHYAAGYYRPAWFVPEAEFALGLRIEAYDDEMKPKKNASEIIAKLHEFHAKEHREQEERVAKLKGPEKRDSDSVQRFNMNVTHLREALTYLANLHDALRKAHKRDKPVKLVDVIKGYDAPNMFTEE